MRAECLVKPFHFETVDVPRPREEDLEEGEVILRLVCGAICGSDLPGFRGLISPNYVDNGRLAANTPGFPMHEVVGEVISSRSDLRVGQRAVGWAKTNNALSEEIVARANSLIPLENSLAPVEQIIIQPLACVIYALSRVGPVESMHAAVIGQGPIGLLFSHVLHSMGARRVTGVDRVDRSDIASSFGVDEAVPTSSDRWARSLQGREKPDLVVEAVGHQTATLNNAIEAVAEGGRIYYFGVADELTYPVDMKKIQRRQLTLISGTTPLPFRRDVLRRAESYLLAHPVLAKSYMTSVFTIDETQQAYECADQPAEGRVKVAVTWS